MPQYQFRLEIQRVADGARFPTAPVPMGILNEVREQAVFLAQRRGLVGPDPGEAVVEVEALRGDPKELGIQGVQLAVGANEHRVALIAGIDLFAGQARIDASRLIKQGQLNKGDKFLFRVFAEETNGFARPAGLTVKVRRKPLPLREGRLGEWLERAVPVGPLDEDDYPLFVTERALELARSYVRKPVDKEGGAMLLGHLYRQREPEPEIFGVIDDAIEARYAEQKLFSLDLTAESFADLNAQLRIRQTRLGRPDEIGLGFAHAHNFLPSVLDDGQTNCPSCPIRATCDLHSSFYSLDDVQFHRALFGKAPFAVGLVWGYTPREEDVVKMFCLEGNQSRERGYFRVKQAAAGAEQ